MSLLNIKHKVAVGRGIYRSFERCNCYNSVLFVLVILLVPT